MKGNFLDFLRSDGFLVVNKKVIKSLGLEEAVFLSDLASRLAWFVKNKGIKEDDWFFVGREEIEMETGLSKYVQRKVVKRLEDLDILETKAEGMPRRMFYRLKLHKLEEILTATTEKTAEVKILTTSSKKFDDMPLKIERHEVKNLTYNNNNNNNNNSVYKNEREELDDGLEKNASGLKQKKNYVSSSGGGAVCPSALHDAEDDIVITEKKGEKKKLFKNSIYNDYDKVIERFKKMDKKRREKYRGIDIEYYMDAVRDWSEIKQVKRTDDGWFSTITQWIRSDKKKGEAVYLKEFLKMTKAVKL